MTTQDRDAILARRALLISAALTGLSCSTHETPSEPKSDTRPVEEASPPAVAPVESPTADPDAKAEGPGSLPAWSEVMAKAPPLEVPAGLSASEHELLTTLAASKRSRYEALAAHWTAPPACAPSAADCGDWASALEAIGRATFFGWGPLCGYSPEVTHTYLARERAHDRYLAELGEQLLAALDAAVEGRARIDDSEAWKRQRGEALGERARPCLSCARPTAEPITDAITFDDGQAAVAQAASPTLADVSRIQAANRQHKAKLLIRGHADFGEDDPEGLARARAEAVAKALVDLGVRRSEIDVRGYGTMLPITRDPAAAQTNRRVDFEVMMP